MPGKKYLSATHRIFAMNAGNFFISVVCIKYLQYDQIWQLDTQNSRHQKQGRPQFSKYRFHKQSAFSHNLRRYMQIQGR